MIDKRKELVQAYDDYIKLLVDELNDVTPLAASHGWKSHRYEEGVRLREVIGNLKSDMELF